MGEKKKNISCKKQREKHKKQSKPLDANERCPPMLDALNHALIVACTVGPEKEKAVFMSLVIRKSVVADKKKICVNGGISARKKSISTRPYCC